MSIEFYSISYTLHPTIRSWNKFIKKIIILVIIPHLAAHNDESRYTPRNVSHIANIYDQNMSFIKIYYVHGRRVVKENNIIYYANFANFFSFVRSLFSIYL